MSELLKGTSLFLVGMMGSGKTTIGQLLAKQLQYRFFDMDVLIEKVAGQSINQIFATAGEANFRQLESQILAELAACTRSVIATGGGVVTQPQNWSYLHHGLVIWLDVPLEQLQQRLEQDKTRPLLQGGDLAEKLQTLISQRRSLYAQADLRIRVAPDETDQQVSQRVAQEITRLCGQKALADERLQTLNQEQPFQLVKRDETNYN